MKKSTLIERIGKKFPQLPEKVVTICVNHIIETITDALAKGERIELRGFGVFSLRYRAARSAHNPKTGTKVVTFPKYVLRFKPGKELRDRVNMNKDKPIIDDDFDDEE